MQGHITFPPMPIGVGGTDGIQMLMVVKRAEELVSAMLTYEEMNDEDLGIDKARTDVLDRVMDMYSQLVDVLDSEYDDGEIFEAYLRMRERKGVE